MVTVSSTKPRYGQQYGNSPLLFWVFFLTVTVWSFYLMDSRVNGRRTSEEELQLLLRQQKQQDDETTTVVEYCEKHRGSDEGEWILDWEYAASAQYETIGSMPNAVIANDKYVPTPAEPFRRATAYKWVTSGGGDSDDNKCPISRILQDGITEFCVAAKTLNIDRIWIAGDSLSEGFSHSLRSQLGFPKQAYLKKLLKPFTLNCTITSDLENGEGEEEIVYHTIEHRFDRIDENFTFGLLEDKNATDRQEFLAPRKEGRTAIVVNLGVHLHSMEEYAEAYKRLWKSLDLVINNNTADGGQKPIIWFRNSSPGHKGCLPEGEPPIKQSLVWEQPIDQIPFGNYSEWKATETNMWDWNLVPFFNQYALRHLPNGVHYINIFNMTVLRRDGHVGFGDCMHYYYPGPIDWWVHLWYSSLKDMAKQVASAEAGVTGAGAGGEAFSVSETIKTK